LNEPEEIESISLSNTVTYPWAVMVMGGYTVVALFAVLAA